ncbi:hypothetical protein SKAU_G00106330 [Synaphobranchus kaupii]|uniref:Uncharacterized protein n=1 Tax=Synaphobranchus kaupii TaxID=118154 RepID=A0A9Q1J5S8_SYNKA|nr:hypothetical protein SKAU_G00106330 [Synaphobranchus kaupii]
MPTAAGRDGRSVGVLGPEVESGGSGDDPLPEAWPSVSLPELTESRSSSQPRQRQEAGGPDRSAEQTESWLADSSTHAAAEFACYCWQRWRAIGSPAPCMQPCRGSAF